MEVQIRGGGWDHKRSCLVLALSCFVWIEEWIVHLVLKTCEGCHERVFLLCPYCCRHILQIQSHYHSLLQEDQVLFI